MMNSEKGLYSIIILWLVFPGVLLGIWTAGYEVLIGSQITAFALGGFLHTAAALSGVGLVVRRYVTGEKTVKHKMMLAFACVMILLVWLLGAFFCWLAHGEEKYHTFTSPTSPDGAHTVVFGERVSLVSGQITVYERVNFGLIVPRRRAITDDGYRPIEAGNYQLYWEGEQMKFSAGDGAGGWITLVLDLSAP